MNKNKLLIYYSVLFVMLVFTWANRTFLPVVIRLAYLVFLFAPCLKYTSLFAPCLILFLTTSLLSFGYTFMPTEVGYYVLIAAVIALVTYSSYRKSIHIPLGAFVAFLVFVTLVNVIHSGTIERITYAFLLFIFLTLTVSQEENVKLATEIIPLCFIIISLACSILIWINQRELMVDFAAGYERLWSSSINYTCSTIGIGVIFALEIALDAKRRKYIRIISLATMIISFKVLLAEASRGAFLVIAVSSVIIILFTKVKVYYKILVLLLLYGVVMYLYQHGYFDLLIYRVEMDDGTGSQRLSIWESKLNSFLNYDNPLVVLWGLGYSKTWGLGGEGLSFIGCHNDFVAFFIEYGVFGLGFLLFFLLFPLIKVSKKTRRHILPYLIFIIVDGLSLEPLSMGYLPMFFLLFYIYILKIKDKTDARMAQVESVS